MKILVVTTLICLISAAQDIGQVAGFDHSATIGVSKLSDVIANFSLALFKEIARSIENVFLSPLSVHSALTMVYLGAANNTRTQLTRGLRLDNIGQQRALGLYRKLADDHLLHNATKTANYTFRLASRLYVDESVALQKDIREQLGSGHVQMLDFIKLPKVARRAINGWIEEQTNFRIKDLIPDGAVNSDSRIVVASATYFRGHWLKPFKEDATHQRDFHVGSGKVVQVDTMWKEDKFRFATDSDLHCSAVELPYSGNETSMVVLLPDRGADLSDVIVGLHQDSLARLISRMRVTTLDLMMPKLKLEEALELTGPMRALGLTDVFDPVRADLTRLHTDQQNLSIPFLRHKTFLEVNEGGTEAAAATALGKRHIELDGGAPVRFIVDRPFVLVIRNKELGTILFIGAIRNPSNTR